ncbi:hypothetical protein JW905_11575 [bacterium]|nr:hypothetical protein [candidate division CSSED10-310 bacterium]
MLPFLIAGGMLARDHGNAGQRRIGTLMLPALIIIGFQTVSLQITFGSPYPNSLPAKIAQGASGKWGEGFLFARWISLLFIDQAMLPLLVPALAGLVWVLRKRFTHLLPPLLYCAALVVGYSFLGIPPYRWYALPFELLLIMTAGIGVGCILQMSRKLVSKKMMATAGVLYLAGYLLFFAHGPGSPRMTFFPQDRVPPYEQAGDYLATHARPGSVLATDEIGIIGYRSNLPIIDLLGVASRMPAEVISGKRMIRMIQDAKPDYIFITELVSIPGYALVLSFGEIDKSLRKRMEPRDKPEHRIPTDDDTQVSFLDERAFSARLAGLILL